MKKIMFNDDLSLTRAVLEGRKTMTRRLITSPEAEMMIEVAIRHTTEYGVTVSEAQRNLGFRYGKYHEGETVAVSRHYYSIYSHLHGEEKEAFYEKVKKSHRTQKPEYLEAWNNKMFVKASLMQDFITIEKVRVGKLHDITDEECMMEGVQRFDTPKGARYIAGGFDIPDDVRQLIKDGDFPLANAFGTPRDAFAAMIDRTSPYIFGRTALDYNPYCVVYQFKLKK